MVPARRQALETDFSSLTSWQLGMYGWITMLLAFVTSHPVNGFLVAKAIEEKL